MTINFIIGKAKQHIDYIRSTGPPKRVGPTDIYLAIKADVLKSEKIRNKVKVHIRECVKMYNFDSVESDGWWVWIYFRRRNIDNYKNVVTELNK